MFQCLHQAACVGTIVGRDRAVFTEVIAYLYYWLLRVIITDAVAKFHEFEEVSQLIWSLL